MNALNQYTWVNGQPDDTVSVFDRGLAFGDGLFETLRMRRGVAPLLDFHLQRMLHGASRLGISISRQQLQADIDIACQQSIAQPDTTWRLKYILTRGSSDSGYAPKPHSKPTRIMLLMPYDAGLARLHQQQGVKTLTCKWRLSAQPALAGIKHLNRLDQIKARQELLDSDCYEGLMKDQYNTYVEGTMSNFFAIAPEGELITPSLDNSGVAGVMRRLVVETLAPAIGIECLEADISRMNEFKEVFITNALMGIVPVLAVDKHQFEIGPVTRQLQQQLQQFLRKS